MISKTQDLSNHIILTKISRWRKFPPTSSVNTFLKAIKEASENTIPPNRNSEKYYLQNDKKTGPLKYIVSLANKYANNRELDDREFLGGNQTNNFLRSKGFRIIDNDDNEIANNDIKQSPKQRHDIPLILYLFREFPNVIIRPIKRSWLKLRRI